MLNHAYLGKETVALLILCMCFNLFIAGGDVIFDSIGSKIWGLDLNMVLRDGLETSVVSKCQKMIRKNGEWHCGRE
jgi:hypothetical protein